MSRSIIASIAAVSLALSGAAYAGEEAETSITAEEAEAQVTVDTEVAPEGEGDISVELDENGDPILVEETIDGEEPQDQ